ncbi:MAG: hypothetical protein JJT89_08210 [Nitriliruptoraceae bacterium]|nr:hypothetical protein [Nitriliruptoraceae bacterium]
MSGAGSTTGFVGPLVRRGARVAAGRLARAWLAEPDRIERRIEVDPHWRRIEDGYAARLGPHQTIAPSALSRPGTRVDVLQPYDGWRRPWAWAGLGLWVGVAGAIGVLGWKAGRGPLEQLAHLDEFGSAITGVGGFGDADLGVDDREAWFG